MTKSTKLGIFIFRRDCRLEDNLGLNLLAGQVDLILPIFILDSNQIVETKANANYFSPNAVQFICECLEDLNSQLGKYKSKLYLFYGNPPDVIKHLLSKLNKSYSDITLGFNTDYSTYSETRDNKIKAVCESLGVNILESPDDFTLSPIAQLVKSDGTAFKQFGAFTKHAKANFTPGKPLALALGTKFVSKTWESKLFSTLKHTYKISDLGEFYEPNDLAAQHGGRALALSKLSTISKFKDYGTKRDLLAYNTTHLSGALNMGCVSVREVYWIMRVKLGAKTQLITQLYWRDFYLTAMAFIPEARSFTTMIDPRYNQIPWPSNSKVKAGWEAMMNSQTGFLLIDAGMQELTQTGFLHNRLRMILGVFWTKYLHISILNPTYGSQVGFSKLLLDAIGPSQNKMNHHWILDFDYPGKKFSAPGAPLSGRPMRIDNSMIKRWDPDCEYIKKWLPHLAEYTPKQLYKWNGSEDDIHPGPIFDPKTQYDEWVKLCKGIK
jgi:deoxyribodipyrimidine photo-lyase